MNTRDTISLNNVDYGHQFSAEELHYLYQSDPIATFAIDTMVNDAVRNGWVKCEAFGNRESITLAMKGGRLYGDTMVVLYDGNADLTTTFSGRASACDVFSPLCNGDGYHDPNSDQLDEKGKVKQWKISRNGKQFLVDASRCVLFRWKPEANSDRGFTALGAIIDDLWVYRKWMNRFGYRASKLPDTILNVNKQDAWNSDDKTEITNALGDVDHVFTSGNTTVTPIAPPFEPQALNTIVEAAKERIAAGLGVAKADLIGAEGGSKLSTDSNQAMYWMTISEIQVEFEPAVKQVVEAFGLKWEGWNSPQETPLEKSIQMLVVLCGAFEGATDLEIKAILKKQITSNFEVN